MLKLLALLAIIVLGFWLYWRVRRDGTDKDITSEENPLDTEEWSSSEESGELKIEESLKPNEVNETPKTITNSDVTELYHELNQVQVQEASIDRYKTVMKLVNRCYKQRKDISYHEVAISLALVFLDTVASLDTASKKELKGKEFMQLAMLLAETSKPELAIKVCHKALSYGLTDGTVSGFEGRIERIEKLKS